MASLGGTNKDENGAGGAQRCFEAKSRLLAVDKPRHAEGHCISCLEICIFITGTLAISGAGAFCVQSF